MRLKTHHIIDIMVYIAIMKYLFLISILIIQKMEKPLSVSQSVCSPMRFLVLRRIELKKVGGRELWAPRRVPEIILSICPYLWNYLPGEIVQCSCMSAFKTAVHSYLV